MTEGALRATPIPNEEHGWRPVGGCPRVVCTLHTAARPQGSMCRSGQLDGGGPTTDDLTKPQLVP